jgi:glycosyltransferase involved in cell wall biosynthesis
MRVAREDASRRLASAPRFSMVRRVSAPLRILYAWDRLLPTTATDAEQATSTMAALARRGHEVTALLPRALGRAGLSADALREQYEVDGALRVLHIPVPLVSQLVLRKAWYAGFMASGGALPAHDLVYTRNSATFMALIARGEKTVYDTHRAWPDHLPPSRPLFRAAMARPSFVGALFHSDFARQSYARIGVDPTRLRTMRNGYDPARFRSTVGPLDARRELDLPLDRKLVVYTGHISALKGLDTLLGMAERCPDALFLLVGSEGDGMVERAAKKRDNVRVLPWQPYEVAARYMVSADVLVLPPSSVGLKVAGHTVLPIKLYGYLAAGRAILAPATPDVCELLRDDDNAVLVEPGDLEAAAAALRALLADDARRARLAERARETGAELTWDRRAENIEAFLYERLATLR